MKKPLREERRREVKKMNCENIRELRTVRGEDEINQMLASGKWRIATLSFEEDGAVATLVRVRI